MRFLFTVFFTTLFSLAGLSVSAQANNVGEWELELEEDEAQLKIYTRKIEGSSLKEFKGEMLVDTTLTALASLLLDAQAATEWMHQCEKFEVIEEVAPQDIVIHFINGAPWPVSDRDAVVSSQMSQDPETLAVRIDVKALTDYMPEDDDFVRIPRMEGHWAFIPTDGKVLVRYQIHAEPGGSLPAWLANSVVVDTPQHTMLNMLDMLKRDNYKQAQLNSIKNVL